MEKYLRVNLLGPGLRLMKKNLPGRGLTKVEKHCSRYDDYNFTAHSLARNTWPVLTFRPILWTVWQVLLNSERSAAFASNQFLAIRTRRTHRRSDYSTLMLSGLQIHLHLWLHLDQHTYQKCAQKYSTYRFTPQHFEYTFRSIPYSVRLWLLVRRSSLDWCRYLLITQLDRTPRYIVLL